MTDKVITKPSRSPQPRTLGEIAFPAELPIVEQMEVISEAIAGHQVVIVAGETGSGKTTQLPKICLQMGRGLERQIGHTQPRRLAARTVAERIASELNTPLGELVGYQVRFTDRVSDRTAVKLMTDGILLAEIQRDALLRSYDTLIIDEAHERSLNIDFLLGYLKQLLPKRPDLKLIITSATIDVDSFSKHFGDAPVIEVSGRTYPVETVYLDPAEEGELGQRQQIAELVDEIDLGRYGSRGDILVFLPGERDIRELAKLLRKRTDLDVLPLYARLSNAEQNRVFDLSKRRGTRVVLATNVAETSLTVPGIRYVIDPGEARISRYSFRTKVQRLPIEAISQASANQRQGRCGRVESGVCLRLYSQEDFDSRSEFTDPEIKRTNLAAVILQMLRLKLGEVDKFPFINPPDPRMVRDGYKLLEELGAVSAKGNLTSLGRKMSNLPVDPRLARMVLGAAENGCLEEVLVIASALAVQDPRDRPADKQQQSDQAHARFSHERSDFLSWLNLWRYYEQQRQALSQNQLRKLCQREFLSFMRMREWRDIHSQLTVACRSMKLKPKSGPAEKEDYQAVHTALLGGLLSNIAQFLENHEYMGCRNRKMQIFPGSSQFKRKPKWMVAGEIVETSKVYARQVAAIDPHWVLGLNPGLLKHHYYEPRWQSRGGRVMAYERITLYGLTVADKRPVHYGPINPTESREILIRQGLIAGNYHSHPDFLKRNLRLVRELEDLESRTRRRDIVADEQVLFDFYDELLPEDAYTAGRLQSWLKKNEGANQSLRVTRERLLASDPGAQVGEQFPNTLVWEDMKFKLSYQFNPGGEADGVTATIPVALMNRVPRHRFDWLVPGLLREKCVALLKGLPKSQRKNLVPAPDYVDRALANLQPDNSDLLEALSRQMSSLGGIKLTRADWNVETLDDYYRMNFRVVDAQGKLLDQGRDLGLLVAKFKGNTLQTVSAKGEQSPARTGLKTWDFGELPKEFRIRQAGVDIIVFPALVDKGESVSIELRDYPSQAGLESRIGLLRLVRLNSATQVKYLRKQLLRGNQFQLALAGAGVNREQLVEDLIDAAYVQAMNLNDCDAENEKAFAALQLAGKTQVIERANELETMMLSALSIKADILRSLSAITSGTRGDTRQDISRQLELLFASNFLRDTPAQWLASYPRYLKALKQRLERLSGQYAKDQKYMAMLAELESSFRALLERRPGLLLECAVAMQYRWMLEELRVSLFAQALGTQVPVSEKRLQEQWAMVESWTKDNPH
ncbi:MAG: ATP-dependent RNA helicase HrpA [Halioglobus sp.]